MTRIGDRAFLFAWQRLRAATQPGPEATAWQVEKVRWSRHRYSLAATDHTVTIEVHRLDHEAWSAMVVVEHWWDERHKPLRNHLWATHLSGLREQVSPWIERQARRIEAGSGSVDHP